MKFSYRQQKIIEIIKENSDISISEIRKHLELPISQPTLNRDLAELVKMGVVERIGRARAIRYHLSLGFSFFNQIDLDVYFAMEVDKRKGQARFNANVFSFLETSNIFDEQEKKQLEQLRKTFIKKKTILPKELYQKELERLTIDLSWKSSQIEGNTYSLLETEELLTQKKEASRKTKEEAIMLLNHKEALNYITKEEVGKEKLTISMIEDIHSILVCGLGVDKNIRKRPVGVTGTTYTPPDNEFQIREYLQRMCDLVNNVQNGYEKAFLTILFISYIQPFGDGNKRTGRIMGNALLMAYNNCPLSYRSVDSLEYKKALLLFYEQNNVQAFKELFIDQSVFAVENYF